MPNFQTQIQETAVLSRRRASRLSNKLKTADVALNDAMRRSAQSTIAYAVKMSSGDLPLADMESVRYWHPYGLGSHDARGRKRGPVTGGDAAILNYQTGDVARSWRVRFRVVGDKRFSLIYNNSKHARFVLLEKDGKKMRARPTLQKIRAFGRRSFGQNKALAKKRIANAGR